MASNVLTSTQMADLRALFDFIDTQHTQKLTASQLSLIINAWGHTISESEVQDIVSEIDVGENGGDGTIDFEEFVMIFTRKFDFEKKAGTNVSKTDERELKDAFTFLDQDRNGSLSAADLHASLAAIGDNYHIEEVKEMIREVCSAATAAAADPAISMAEFRTAMSP